jgi:uncharacterized repeat protein (TIGR02543 family)
MCKKYFLQSAIVLVSIITLAISACGGNSPSDPYSYTVIFDKNSGDTEAIPATKTVDDPATTVGTLPATEPTKSGYDFAGWYTAVTGGTAFTATTTVTENITVFAQWTPKTIATIYRGTYEGYEDEMIPGGETLTFIFGEDSVTYTGDQSSHGSWSEVFTDGGGTFLSPSAGSWAYLYINYNGWNGKGIEKQGFVYHLENTMTQFITGTCAIAAAEDAATNGIIVDLSDMPTDGSVSNMLGGRSE